MTHYRYEVTINDTDTVVFAHNAQYTEEDIKRVILDTMDYQDPITVEYTETSYEA